MRHFLFLYGCRIQTAAPGGGGGLVAAAGVASVAGAVVGASVGAGGIAVDEAAANALGGTAETSLGCVTFGGTTTQKKTTKIINSNLLTNISAGSQKICLILKVEFVINIYLH